jgi:nucleotide-binding universal stress UspA family protein
MPQSHNLGYEEIQETEGKLEREMRNLFQENTIPYEEHLVVTKMSAGEELVEYAEGNKIDEIVIGVRRRSKVGKLVFGSTAQYVILNAPCPVVTIK